MEGFRAILRRPSLGFAEIAWRWSFGAAASLLVAFACFEYLDTLPVTRGDLLLLRSRQPALIWQAVAQIVRGSGARLVEALLVLALMLTVGWTVMAALGRAATVKALLIGFRSQDEPQAAGRIYPFLGLNFLRAAALLAAFAGCFAGIALGGMASTPDEAGMVFQIVMIIFALVWLTWSMVNWLLSLAAIFVLANGRDTLGAIADAVDLLRRRSGAVIAVGTSFGLAHAAALVLASIAAAVPMGLAGALSGRIVLAALTAITLLYFAVADFLYMGRLAAYVAILEWPEPDVQPLTLSLHPGGIDRNELILSDLPPPLET